jgi:hypothetical protein
MSKDKKDTKDTTASLSDHVQLIYYTFRDLKIGSWFQLIITLCLFMALYYFTNINPRKEIINPEKLKPIFSYETALKQLNTLSKDFSCPKLLLLAGNTDKIISSVKGVENQKKLRKILALCRSTVKAQNGILKND